MRLRTDKNLTDILMLFYWLTSLTVSYNCLLNKTSTDLRMFNKILINYSSVVLALMCIGINSYPDILSRYFSSRIFWRISEKLVSTALVKNLQRIKCFCPCHHSKYIHARCQMKELSRIIRYSTYVAFSHPSTFLLISARVYA